MYVQSLAIDYSFLSKDFYGEPVSNYIWFVAIILLTLLLKGVVANLLTRISSRLASKLRYIQYKKAMRDMLLKPIERLSEVVLFYIAFNQISDLLDTIVLYHSISKKGKVIITLSDGVEHLFLFFFILFVTQVVTRIVDIIYLFSFNKASDEKNHARLQLLPLIKEVSKFGIWSICLFWALGSVFHVNVPALITGLGIGGVAIALAGKETVENFFAAFTLLSDKPFQVGDYVKLPDAEGQVVLIGFRSTKLRALDGALVIIPNKKLVNQNLINVTTREVIGIRVTFNLHYGLSEQKLDKINLEVRALLEAMPFVTNPIYILMDSFGVETFQYVVIYNLPNIMPDGVDYYDARREVNTKIYGILSSNAILGFSISDSITQ